MSLHVLYLYVFSGFPLGIPRLQYLSLQSNLTLNFVSCQIMETNRSEESPSHVHRLYFQGPNTFSEPWHLPHCPPEQVKDIVYASFSLKHS